MYRGGRLHTVQLHEKAKKHKLENKNRKAWDGLALEGESGRGVKFSFDWGWVNIVFVKQIIDIWLNEIRKDQMKRTNLQRHADGVQVLLLSSFACNETVAVAQVRFIIRKMQDA
jgi:hypothetical protein